MRGNSPPAAPLVWAELDGINCHGPYNGAVNVGMDVTLAMMGGVDGCKSACYAEKTCEAVTVTTVIVDWEDHDFYCGLRSKIWYESCINDGHHQTFYLASPLRAAALPRGIVV